jgi:hypothetical protein
MKKESPRLQAGECQLQLTKKKKYLNTPAGKRVFLLCSGTDPYQDREVTAVTSDPSKKYPDYTYSVIVERYNQDDE